MSSRLLSWGQSHSVSSLQSSSGYGWYEEGEDDEDDDEESLCDDPVAVLKRMETARDDLAISTTTTSRLGPAPSTTILGDEEDEAEEMRARVVAQASSAQRQVRGKAAAAGAGVQVLFTLAQGDFNVLTKVFAREHCGPLLPESDASGPFDHSAAGGAGTVYHGKPKKDCFLALGVGGFRIVQDVAGSNQYAQFNVILCLVRSGYACIPCSSTIPHLGLTIELNRTPCTGRRDPRRLAAPLPNRRPIRRGPGRAR